MNRLSETILKNHQVRKTKAQKDAFIALMREHFPDLKTEAGGFMNSRNLILGDPDTAKVVFTAHYDTPPLSVLPNLIMPYKKGLRFAYTMLALLPYIAALLVTFFLTFLLSDSTDAALVASLVVYYGLYFGKFYFGLPNPHNANDNTSGVVTLLAIYEAMTPEQRQKAAFVFFDNEEYGCVGSGLFYKQHKARMDEKLLVNFDCVGDGDRFLLVCSNDLPQDLAGAVRAAFPEDGRVVTDTAKHANHSSDHKHFRHFLSVAAVYEHPVLGLSTGRIHTVKDTVLNMENIRYLAAAGRRLTEAM